MDGSSPPNNSLNKGEIVSGQTPRNAALTGNNKFLKTVKILSTLAGWTSAAMIVVAVILTCQMIFVRFVLNGSTIWQTEAIIYLVVSATLIGLSYVQLLRGHVNVDLIPLMLFGRVRWAMAIFTLSISSIIIAIIVWYGYEHWHLAYSRGWKSDTVWGVRLWIPYLSIPVGFGLLLLQLIADLVAVVTKVEKPFGLEDA